MSTSRTLGRMRVVTCTALVGLLLLGGWTPATAQELVVCGWDEVFVLDVSAAPKKDWSAISIFGFPSA